MELSQERARGVWLAVVSGLLWLAAMLSGTLGVGSLLIWVAFVPLIIALERDGRRAFLLFAVSFLLGTGVYLALVSIQVWMYAFAAVFPLILAGAMGLVWRFVARPAPPPLRAGLMVLTAVCLDWAVAATPITAVISPSITLADTPFLALAGVVGFPGVTLAILTVNVLIYTIAFTERRAKTIPYAVGAALLVAAGFVLAWIQPSWHYAGRRVLVSALDGGMHPGGAVAPPARLSAEREKLPAAEGVSWDVTEGGGEIVLWPEKFYPEDILADETTAQRLADAASHTVIVPFVSEDRNMAVPVSSRGFEETYTKLKPARVLGEGVVEGSEQPIYEAPTGWRYGLLICFDMHFERYARQLVSGGAEMILVPSNSNARLNSQGWVKRVAALRAVEGGVPVVVATDIGSYIVDHRGRVVRQSDGHEPEIISAEVAPNPIATLYVHGGHAVRYLFVAGFVVLLATGIVTRVRSRSRSASNRRRCG